MDIPGYKILDTLGKGGMATVYLAIQESFDRKVAVKVMSPQLAQDPSFGDRFQREARIVSQMNHPNIVTVYDVGVVNNHHYLAMQYVQGKELRYKLKALNLVEKITVIKEVASALNYAGNKGYVHRDVKPENVMLSEEDGRAILMDFGIAKTTDNDHSMTKTGMAIGTPYYMSPEQAQGKPVDKRSDIYSLGVMFFQLLTGRVPYDAESQVAIGIKHITEPVPPLPKHLSVFQPIIDKVMAKDPASRYQTGADFIKDLEKISSSDLENISRDAVNDSGGISKTDPNAATVLAGATPAPVLKKSGVATSADAARPARNGSGQQSTELPAKKSSSLLIAVVAVIVLVGGGWFFFQTNKEPSVGEVAIQQNAPEVPVQVEQNKPVAAETASVEPVVNSSALSASAVEQESKKANEADEQLAREKREEEARAAAQLQKEKQAALAKAEKIKMEELARAKEQDAAKAEQMRQQEISSRLGKAESLREQGQLVAPAGNNALESYRNVLEFDPGNTKASQAIKDIESAYFGGIRSLIDQGNLEESANKLREANKAFPNSIAVGELLALQQKKMDAIAAAKMDAGRPKVTKVLVSDVAFETMQLAQKADMPMGRTAYIGFGYQNFEGATSLMQAVLYDSSRTIKITQKPVVVTGTGGAIYFTLARPVEGFPDGRYNLDLLLDEQKMASVTFTVKH